MHFFGIKMLTFAFMEKFSSIIPAIIFMINNFDVKIFTLSDANYDSEENYLI